MKRESHFLQQELLYLQSLLDGSDTLNKNREPDPKLNSRHNKLLMPSKVETVPDLDETKIKQLMTKFAPKNDEEFKNVFLKWIRHFMGKYLMRSLTPIQDYLFYIKWNEDLMPKLNPDIAGAMTQSILNV